MHCLRDTAMGIDYFNLVEGMFWIGLGVWLVVTRRVVRRGRRMVPGVYM